MNKPDSRGLGPQPAEGQEMDGGMTNINGKPMRIILDHCGRFKEHREVDPKGKSNAPSSLDEATRKAMGTRPAALDMIPEGEGAGGRGQGEGEGAGGRGRGQGNFRPPA